MWGQALCAGWEPSSSVFFLESSIVYVAVAKDTGVSGVSVEVDMQVDGTEQGVQT